MTDTAPSPRRHQLVVVATFVVLAVVILGLTGWLTSNHAGRSAAQTSAGTITAPTTDYGRAPSYTLTDQLGRPFRSAALRGKVQVVSYLFPYCRSQCPIIGRTLAQAEQRLRQRGMGDSVDFVAFNVDPVGAGPAQMRAFLQEFDVDPGDPHWHFLTGTGDAVRRVVQGGFHVFYQQVSLAEEQAEAARQHAAGGQPPRADQPNPLADKAHVTYDIVHNDTVEVVGPDGVIRQLFASGAQTSTAAVVAAVEQAVAVN